MSEQNLIVISKKDLIRKNFAEKFPILGYEVFTFDDIYEPIKSLNSLNPDLVIIDIGEEKRKWKIFVSGIKLAKKKIDIILLTDEMTLDEANEALILGASGIIVKPFFPEVHLKRIFEIVHRKSKRNAKRIYPRFYAGSAFQGELIFENLKKNKRYSFPLVNICEVGTSIRLDDPANASELIPKYSVQDACLKLDNQEIHISFRIVFRTKDLIGIGFTNIGEEKSNFIRFIQILNLKVFGKSGIRGKW